jgi:hypothetical protein
VNTVEDDIKCESSWSKKLPLQPTFTHAESSVPESSKILVNERVRNLPDRVGEEVVDAIKDGRLRECENGSQREDKRKRVDHEP